jgi:carbonic anhydrase
MPIQRLISGIHKFQGSMFREKKALFERLAKSHAADTLFITCSDARIDPNLMTAAMPGQLFTMRNVGNIVPMAGKTTGGEGPTIEFAVETLKVNDIIICGHSNCGAIKAMLDPSLLEDVPMVARWLEHAEGTRRILWDAYQGCTREQLIEVAIQENVLVQLENLRTHPSVSRRLQDGTLKLHGWVYTIDTGEVYVYEPSQERFQSIADDRMLTELLSGLRPRS